MDQEKLSQSIDAEIIELRKVLHNYSHMYCTHNVPTIILENTFDDDDDDDVLYSVVTEAILIFFLLLRAL